MTIEQETVRRLIGLLDLTSLGDNDDEAVIDDLCARAATPAGPVAAVCVWPKFVAQCVRTLNGTGIRVAAVANFPVGALDVECAIRETRFIREQGGTEVDVVLPYAAWLEGNRQAAHDLVGACKEACGVDVHLKVIIETGRLVSPENIAGATDDAIAAGADFIKTSSGKVEVSATPEAARVMLERIRAADRPVGFKAAGGIRTADDGAVYLGIADQIMGEGWATPETFRIGASGLLGDLLSALKTVGTE